MSFGVRKAQTGCNFVHNDEIWKDHVRRELQTSRKWPDKWGFLSKAPQEMSAAGKRFTGQVKLKSGSNNLPSINKERKTVSGLVTLIDCALNEGANHTPNGGNKQNYPHTTASEIGWKCADFSTLERFGRHARGQQGIRHLLGWPREAVY